MGFAENDGQRETSTGQQRNTRSQENICNDGSNQEESGAQVLQRAVLERRRQCREEEAQSFVQKRVDLCRSVNKCKRNVERLNWARA